MEHDGLECITAACGMYQAVLNTADEVGTDREHPLSPEDELRVKMPLMLAQLSPQARAMLNDHLDHMRELVAYVHRMTAYVAEASNRSSA